MENGNCLAKKYVVIRKFSTNIVVQVSLQLPFSVGEFFLLYTFCDSSHAFSFIRIIFWVLKIYWDQYKTPCRLKKKNEYTRGNEVRYYSYSYY